MNTPKYTQQSINQYINNALIIEGEAWIKSHRSELIIDKVRITRRVKIGAKRLDILYWDEFGIVLYVHKDGYSEMIVI